MFNSITRIFTLLGLLGICANTQTASHGRIIVATDLNGVIIKKDTLGITKKVITNVGCVKKARAYKRKTGLGWGEELYTRALNEGKHKIAHTIKHLCLAQRVSKRVLNIYKKLRAQGVELIYATNNGPVFMAELKHKFPQVFNQNFIQDGLTAENKLEKPDQRYFDRLIQRLNPDKNDTIIFIDDMPENCAAAKAWAQQQQLSLIAIHFTSASQLKQQLRALRLNL